MENHEREEWGGWKIISDMLDNHDPRIDGIYKTSEAYQKLFEFVVEQKKKVLTQALAKAHMTSDAREIRHEIKELYLSL